MELDLNQEPLDPTRSSVIELDSILNELESAQAHIQDRIRHLEAVTSRARQRHRWPPVHSPIQITNFTGEAAANDAQGEEREHQEDGEGIVESGKEGKREGGACLIARALGMKETYATMPGLSYTYSNVKECPVCHGEVTEKGIIPIYGNARASDDCQLDLKETGLRVPPRPRAPRIECVRQQLISQGASSSVVENIRRFSNLIGGLGERVQSESSNAATVRNNSFLIHSHPQSDNHQHTGSPPISRFLEQGAASFSSLSSALNSAMDSAERLVQDLESYIHDRHLGGSRQLNPHDVIRNSTFSVAGTSWSASLTTNVAATNSAAAASLSPISRNVNTVAVTGSEAQTTDSNVQISPIDPSSSYSRRTNISRQDSNGRRRRLR
ncbi:E3 ubiquitin-protein ligase [Sesbania bispinosa]|nr:E3 ubiquitin-protein ligase [Sesbania bispinosa]